MVFSMSPVLYPAEESRVKRWIVLGCSKELVMLRTDGPLEHSGGVWVWVGCQSLEGRGEG